MSNLQNPEQEADRNVEIWKIKKLIKSLEAARGWDIFFYLYIIMLFFFCLFHFFFKVANLVGMEFYADLPYDSMQWTKQSVSQWRA